MFGIDLLSIAIGVVIGGTCTVCVPKAWAIIKNNWIIKLVASLFKGKQEPLP